MPNWKDRINEAVKAIIKQATAIAGDYAQANAAAVAAAVDGRGPDDPIGDPRLGAHAVFNIPAVHILAFCEETKKRQQAPAAGKDAFRPYKNGYDLAKYRVGGDPKRPLKTRELVDAVLPLPAGHGASEVYFAAAELNGSGVRFYGDICLVLKSGAVAPTTIVLESNSYDLIRAPLDQAIASDAATRRIPVEQARKERAAARSGVWSDNLGSMAALKIVGGGPRAERRLTTGAISDGILFDEDYIEVLHLKTFGADDVEEARVTAGDVALETRIGDELREGRAPTAEEISWRKQRRAAVAKLRAAGVPVRVVTTTGRVRSS